jgi:hypothetical protein
MTGCLSEAQRVATDRENSEAHHRKKCTPSPMLKQTIGNFVGFLCHYQLEGQEYHSQLKYPNAVVHDGDVQLRCCDRWCCLQTQRERERQEPKKLPEYTKHR